MFADNELHEEGHEDDHLDNYDDDYEEEEERVVGSYYGNYSVGNFTSTKTKSKVDDLGELLQTSKKFQKALNQTKLTGGLYVDHEFDPDFESLIGYSEKPDRINDMRAFVFKRSAEYFGSNVHVFDTMDSGDILQGQLGDCYFLAAISSIAEKPERLKRLFLSKKNHGNGIYALAMCINGVWEEVIMDDFAPCLKNGKLAFNNSKTNEMWVILLEKAWAKIHGGYLNIEAGLTREALRDLTGASAKTFFLRQNPEDIWDKLMEAERLNYIMTAGSDNLSGGSDAYIQKIGICGSHAYSLLAVYQVHWENGRHVRKGPGEQHSERLVKLRNPWGSGEWHGKWSDSDRNWTPELKQMVGFTGKKEDGIFFMPWEEFIKYYSDCQICYFHDGYKYSAEKYQTKRNETVYLRFRLDTPGKYYFSVNQRNRRFYSKNSGYKYTKISWLAARRNGNQVEFMGSGNKVDKENWDDCECEAGEYYAIINTPWRSQSREFSFSVYGPGLTDLERIRADELPDNFISNVFKSKAQQDLPTKGTDFSHRQHPNIKYVSGERNGWAYFYCENKEDDVVFNMTLKLGNKGSGVTVIEPHKGPKPTTAVGPGENDIIVYKSSGPKAVSVSMMTSFKKVTGQHSQRQPQGGSSRGYTNGGHSSYGRQGHSSHKPSTVRPYQQGGSSYKPRIYNRNDDRRRITRPRQHSQGGVIIKKPGSHYRNPSTNVPAQVSSDILERARKSTSSLTKSYKGRPVEIRMNFLFHKDGIAILYSNQTQDLTLSENISFSLRNAMIKGVEGNIVQFSLGPGKEKLIEAVRQSSQMFDARVNRISYDINKKSLFASNYY